MTEEERALKGYMYQPSHPELVKIKTEAHILSEQYNLTTQEEAEKRQNIIEELFPDIGEDCVFQGPIHIHYGTHTHIGKNLFANFNLTIQDDASVTIGDHCSFGPNVTIVTPSHPLVAEERLSMKSHNGYETPMCFAKPVVIGDNCWLGANVVVNPGVTIGENSVIGSGSVVTKDIPANSLAFGVPCRAVRKITQADSMAGRPELLDDEVL